MAFRFFSIITCLVTVAIGAAAGAAEHCTPSAGVAAANYPGEKWIINSNNLMRPAGKNASASGQQFIFTGRVLDSNCVPVPGAIVELWQASPYGHYEVAEGEDLASPNAVFAGTGRTVTDSDGVFNFVTAFPAPTAKDRAPFLNIKVKTQGLGSYSSALYFSGDARNESDARHKKISGKAKTDTLINVQQGENGDLLGSVTLVVSGKVPYRTY